MAFLTCIQTIHTKPIDGTALQTFIVLLLDLGLCLFATVVFLCYSVKFTKVWLYFSSIVGNFLFTLAGSQMYHHSVSIELAVDRGR